MAEKDFQKRQDSPTLKPNNTRQDFKLLKRKEKLMEILQAKRHPPNQIQGYDLHKYRKYHKKKKNCWSRGSTNHLKFDCPVLKKKQLLKRVVELEHRIYQLEEALQIIQKNKAKRERKKKRRKKKKKQKEHQQIKKDCNSAVKLRNLLLMEEQQQDLTNFLQADSYIKKLPGRTQESVKRAYKELFSRDFLTDMVEACTWGDEYYYSIEEGRTSK